jgi:hypothetical protein
MAIEIHGVIRKIKPSRDRRRARCPCELAPTRLNASAADPMRRADGLTQDCLTNAKDDSSFELQGAEGSQQRVPGNAKT